MLGEQVTRGVAACSAGYGERAEELVGGAGGNANGAGGLDLGEADAFAGEGVDVGSQ